MEDQKSTSEKVFTKKNIAFQLLTILLSFFIQPLSPFIVNFFLGISTFFSNYYYSSLSDLSIYLFLTEINIAIILCVSMLLTLLYLKYHSLFEKLSNKATKSHNRALFQKKRINNLTSDKDENDEYENSENINDESIKELELDVDTLVISTKRVKSDIDLLKLKMLQRLQYASYLIIFLLYLFFAFAISKSNDIDEFKKQTRILKPYITAFEYDVLYSKWSRMESKQDFDELDSLIRNLEKNNLSK